MAAAFLGCLIRKWNAATQGSKGEIPSPDILPIQMGMQHILQRRQTLLSRCELLCLSVCLPACLSICVCVREVLYPGDLVFALIMPTSHWHFKADFISHCLRGRVCECVCGDGGWHLGAMAPVWKFARQHITRFNDSSRMSQVSGQDNDFGRLFSRLTIWHFKVVLSTEDLIN